MFGSTVEPSYSYSAMKGHVMNDSLQRRSAAYVDKLLKGATPADLPVEPTTFKLGQSQDREGLDLTVLDKLPVAADEVIE